MFYARKTTEKKHIQNTYKIDRKRGSKHKELLEDTEKGWKRAKKTQKRVFLLPNSTA